MPRKAPRPRVRFYLSPSKKDETENLCKKMSEAHLVAVRSFISTLNLDNDEKEAMKELLP